MRIRILGAAREVGRSAILVEDDGSRILLDYGVLVGNGRDREVGFPIHVRPKDVDALVISHAHLDHSGAAPLLISGAGEVPVYATRATMQLSELLLNDFLKVSGELLPFTGYEVGSLVDGATEVGYGERFEVGGVGLELIDAGHVPGSSMVYLEGSRRVLYTGDMNRNETELLSGYGELPEVDVVISESTYSQTEHPRREDEERAFVEFAREVVERKGTLLVPAFAVGRAQEVAMALWRYGFQYPVYMDGMALTANSVLLSNPEYLRDAGQLEKALDRVKYVRSWGERHRIVNEPCVIISPAGMLVGGAAIFYSKEVSSRERNGIGIVSYQAPETPGRRLLERKELEDEGGRRKVKAEVRRFDFSSHSGRGELLKFFEEDLKGNPKVVLVHGDEEPMIKFAEELRAKGFDVVTPVAGQEIEVA